MKKLSKSIQRVDWNVACFGLLKVQDPSPFPVSKELLLTVLHKFPPKKGLFSISYTSVPLKTRRQGTIPLIQGSKFSARRAYGKVTKSPSLKKTRITKTKAKESYPCPPVKTPRKNKKISWKTWCYQRKRSWSSFATEEEGEKSLDFVIIASYRGKQVKRRPRV